MKQLFFCLLFCALTTSSIFAQKKEGIFWYSESFDNSISITHKIQNNLHPGNLKQGMVFFPFYYTDSLFTVYLKEILPEEKMESLNQSRLTMDISFTNKGKILGVSFFTSKEKVDFFTEEELYKFYQKVMNMKLDTTRWVITYKDEPWDYTVAPIFIDRMNRKRKSANP